MLKHPIRFYLAILPLYVMAGLLLFRGPGAFAKTREANSSTQGSEGDPTKDLVPAPAVAIPSPVPPEALETALKFELLPISETDLPENAISEDFNEKLVPARVRDRLNRSLWWICRFKKKETEHMGSRRRLAKARIDDRFDLYVCMEHVIPTAPADMLLVIWDRKERMASEQSRIIRCSRSWNMRDGFPKVNRSDLDLDGRPEIVLHMNEHNGTVYDATEKHHLSINPDLTLRRSLNLITKKWDGRPWNPDHRLDRTIHPVDRNELVIRTWRTSSKAPERRSEIGRVLLRREDQQMPYEVTTIQAWDAEDGHEVKDFSRSLTKHRLAAEAH